MPRANSRVVSPALYEELERVDYFPHRVTIKRAATSRSTSGAVVPGESELILSAIPARVFDYGSMGLRRAAGIGEVRRADGTLEETITHVELNGSYEDIREQDVAEFNAHTWNVVNVAAAAADGRTILELELVA